MSKYGDIQSSAFVFTHHRWLLEWVCWALGMHHSHVYVLLPNLRFFLFFPYFLLTHCLCCSICTFFFCFKQCCLSGRTFDMHSGRTQFQPQSDSYWLRTFLIFISICRWKRPHYSFQGCWSSHHAIIWQQMTVAVNIVFLNDVYFIHLWESWWSMLCVFHEMDWMRTKIKFGWHPVL
jgi:hypothetical protein